MKHFCGGGKSIFNLWTVAVWAIMLAGCGPQKEEQAVQNQPATSQQPVQAGVMLPHIALRLKCVDQGMYRLTGKDMEEAGVDLSLVDASQIALVNFDTPVPYYAQGLDDGRMNPSDSIMFYSVGCDLDPHTHINIEKDFAPQAQIFMLHLGASGYTPLRYTQLSSDVSSKEDLVKYPPLVSDGRLHFEKNENWEFFKAHNTQDMRQDYFYWQKLTNPASNKTSNETDLEFYLPELERSEEAQLSIKFIGSCDQWGKALEMGHSIQVDINGKFNEEQKWVGWEPHLCKLTLPPNVLRKGSNRLKITLNEPEQAGAGQNRYAIDILVMDWFEVSFKQKALVDQDINEFYRTVDPEKTEPIGASVRNFSSKDILAFVPQKAQMLQTKPFAMPSSGYWGANFEIPQDCEHLVMLTPEGCKKPNEMSLRSIKAVSTRASDAELLIVTHSDFTQDLQRLVEWKQSRGLRTELVQVEDLFDEMTGGYASPYPIRDYLKTIYSSQPEPCLKYVMLVGDSSTIVSYKTFVPAYAFLQSGTHASDNFFAVYDDNEREAPTVAVGRLSVRSSEQLNHAIDKIIAYESKKDLGPWRARFLMIAASSSWASKDALGLIDRFVEPNYLADYLHTDPGTKDPKLHEILSREIFDALDQGNMITSFFGHGGGTVWEVGPTAMQEGFLRAHLFDQDMVAKLTNGERPTLVFASTCYTNDFDNPHVVQTLGETFVNSPGGAVAVFGAASRTGISLNSRFVDIFFGLLFEHKYQRLGDYLVDSKRLLKSSVANRQYLLLGDPSLEFSLPLAAIKVSGLELQAEQGTLHAAYELPSELTLPAKLYGFVQGDGHKILAQQEVAAQQAQGELSFKLDAQASSDTLRVVLYAANADLESYVGGSAMGAKPEQPQANKAAEADDASSETSDQADDYPDQTIGEGEDME